MLLIDKADGIATLTLNRPEVMNALSRALRTALFEAFSALIQDDSVRAIILTGAGERAFTAGVDLKELSSDTSGLNTGEAGADPMVAITACPKPIIGAINGVAITGGFELALACDVLIASTHARFADTHARVGVAPGWGLSQKLSRVIGLYRAKELSLSGNCLDARTAAAWGLVNRVVEPGELMPAARKLAADMASVPAEMSRYYKRLIDDGYALPFGEAMALEAKRSGERNAALTPDTVAGAREGVIARGREQ